MTAINPSLAAMRPDVAAAIRTASAASGIDSGFLFKQAEIESGFDPDARARTSSATGLYQFIEQTWLHTVKRHGAEHGLGWAADAITRQGGHLQAGSQQAEILALRSDPRAAAAMAAAFAADNRDHLEGSLGRQVRGTDLYLAHFLGPAGAAQMLRSRDTDPSRPAAEVLPDAARSNRPIFFNGSGRARSLNEVYQLFADKFDDRGGPGQAIAATPSDEQRAALAATQAWVAQRGALGEVAPTRISPASARLLYLTLTSAGL